MSDYNKLMFGNISIFMVICIALVVGACGGTIMYVRHIIKQHSEQMTAHMNGMMHQMMLKVNMLANNSVIPVISPDINQEEAKPNVGGGDEMVTVSDGSELEECSAADMSYIDESEDDDEDEDTDVDDCSSVCEDGDNNECDDDIEIEETTKTIQMVLVEEEENALSDKSTIVKVELPETIEIPEIEVSKVDVPEDLPDLIPTATLSTDYKKMLLPELKLIAVNKGVIEASSRLKKGEIITLLEKADLCI